MKLTIKDLSINYETVGKGMPLLAIHGWGVDHRLMSGCLEPLFSSSAVPLGCRRIYPDLPGMGQTPGTSRISGSDDMLDYLEAFIEAVIPGEPFLLAGESYGGYLSRGLLRRMPDRIRGLLLIAPTFKPWVKTETGFDKGDVPDHRVVEEDTGFMARLTEEERNTFRFLGIRLTENAWNLFKKDVLPGIKAADHQFLENHLSRRVPFTNDPDTGAEPWPCPALIITGRQDAVVGYKGIWSLLEQYPRATFAVLDGTGHNLQTERVPLFESLVTDWLERVKQHT
jgi:pimeloyl-ACP methyl ester carboxylesterase